jgi:DNA-binding transcriptional MerR regulator
VSPFTIGEVLNRLKDEFDDITISKIRFLESEGLISPDRTESGYRKFTDADVERLRYILRAQRDRYLPLKVIGEELEEIDARGGGFPDDTSTTTAPTSTPTARWRVAAGSRAGSPSPSSPPGPG